MVEQQEDNMAVLLVDISDSTRIYETLGDEVAFREMRACLDLFERAVSAHGGRVAKTLGDGMICLFDAPSAAMTAGCDMQTSLGERVARQTQHIGIRVGLHCGPVVHDGDNVYGDTIKVATRVTQFAASGQIIATDDLVSRLPPHLRSVTRRLDAFPALARGADIAVHEVLWQASDEYTQMPGRLQAVLAAAGIVRMYLRQGGHEMVVVTTMTLGRDDGNDIVLKERMASRNHAQIERRKDKYVLIDLSSNGTYVRMENGDQIKLHREEMILYGSGTITFGHMAGNVDEDAITFRIE